MESMDDNLFSHSAADRMSRLAPLAVRMRPRHLKDYIGQEQAVGKDSWLRRAIEHDVLSSVILYGPAGTGKTTLAQVIANTTDATFRQVSAIGGSVKDLRKEIQDAERRLLTEERRTILFIDEIHRFSKSQQDALLHAVEDRVVVLIGATTENPYFEVNQALLSRSRVVELTYLSDQEIIQVVSRALGAPEGLAGRFQLTQDALRTLVAVSAGDARSALTTLELASQMAAPAGEAGAEVGEPIIIGAHDVEEVMPSPNLAYDKGTDLHYDTISAFIKSMRGSDPDAALYWLGRMLVAGEDPKFIARRIFILASEDIGNADPNALLVAEAAFRACEVIGMPECRINLAQACVYMALAPKSNASYLGINAAMADARKHPSRQVPAHLRDRHRPGSDTYGPYLYPHDYPAGYVAQRYLPEGLEPGCFYTPGPRGWEGWRWEGTQRDRLDR